MNLIVFGILILILVITILWPYFIIIVVLFALYLAYLHNDRTNLEKSPPPLWTWGKQKNQVVVKLWKHIASEIRMEFHEVGGKNNWVDAISVEDSFNHEKFSAEKDNYTIQVSNTSRHVFIVDDLTQNMKYIYRFIDVKTQKILLEGAHFIFYTKPATFEPFEFTVCGDSQQSEVLALLESYMWNKIRKEDPSFMLYLGDHVHDYKFDHLWFAFFRMMKNILPRIPYYPTIGNHCGGDEIDAGKTAGLTYMLHPNICNYFEKGQMNWNYSWEYQNVYFISLNSITLLLGNQSKVEKTEEWLKEQIKNKPKNATFTIVYTHIPWIGPPYSQKGEKTSYEIYMEENWKPILDSDEVDLVISGHKHSYVRDGKYLISASIHGVRKYEEASEDNYVVKNTHHYLVINVEKDTLQVQAKSMGGKIIDSLKISK